MPMSVMLVDDHELIRQGLRRAFERDVDFTVVGEAATVAEANKVAETTQPAVAVIDVRLPDGSGLELAQKLRQARADIGLVILTMYARNNFV